MRENHRRRHQVCQLVAELKVTVDLNVQNQDHNRDEQEEYAADLDEPNELLNFAVVLCGLFSKHKQLSESCDLEQNRHDGVAKRQGCVGDGGIRIRFSDPEQVVKHAEGEVCAELDVLVAEIVQVVVDVLLLPQVGLNMLLVDSPGALVLAGISEQQEDGGRGNPTDEQIELDVHPFGVRRVKVTEVLEVATGEERQQNDRAQVSTNVDDVAEDRHRDLDLLFEDEEQGAGDDLDHMTPTQVVKNCSNVAVR